jgi:diguanylate cyclase (GGDEF)-like protein
MFVDFAKLNRLPSLPVVAVRLLERFADPDVALSTIVKIIQSDPAITAKLMRAANSVQYGVGRPVTNLNRAVSLLGKKTVTSLALCFSLTEESMKRGAFAGLYRTVWLQSIIHATAAEVLARRFDRGMEGEYFAVALLADIGRLAMLKTAPLEYAAVAERVDRDHLDVEACEDETFGVSHTSLSIALLEHWNLPAKFCNAVRCRHLGPEVLLDLAPGEERRLSHAVALATAVGNYFCHGAKGMALVRVAELAGSLYDLSPEESRTLLNTIQARVSSSAELFETDLSRLGSPTDLMAEAMEQLGRLAAAAGDGGVSDDVRNQLLDENGRLKRRIQELVRLTSIDALTGVFNRGYFDEQYSERIAIGRAARQPLGLLFLDADHFKRINDEFGHPAGDQVLRQLAHIISRSVRCDDVVARYGGEEFVVIVANPTRAALEALGERIRQSVEQERIVIDGGTLRMTISAGGAYAEPPYDDGLAERLLNTADAALYAAKNDGRNRVEIRSYRPATLEPAAFEETCGVAE